MFFYQDVKLSLMIGQVLGEKKDNSFRIIYSYSG